MSGGVATLFFPSKNVIHPTKLLLAFQIAAASFFFLSFGCAVSSMLKIIRQQNFVDLDKWQRFYGHIGELMDKINDGFGLFLLINIVMIFVWNVCGLFSALVSFWENKTGIGILITLLIQLFILPFFLALVYVPHCIKKEVNFNSEYKFYAVFFNIVFCPSERRRHSRLGYDPSILMTIDCVKKLSP